VSLLIGGTTDYAANDQAPAAVMKERTRTDADYATRVGHRTGSWAAASTCISRLGDLLAEPAQCPGGGGRESAPAGRGWARAAKRRNSACVS
jgi:hypothetical protein